MYTQILRFVNYEEQVCICLNLYVLDLLTTRPFLLVTLGQVLFLARLRKRFAFPFKF
jgi:hypothetical protein